MYALYLQVFGTCVAVIENTGSVGPTYKDPPHSSTSHNLN